MRDRLGLALAGVKWVEGAEAAVVSVGRAAPFRQEKNFLRKPSVDGKHLRPRAGADIPRNRQPPGRNRSRHRIQQERLT